jgi:hypothetical protein
MMIFEIEFTDGSSDVIPISSEKDWSVDDAGYLIIQRYDGARILAPLASVICARISPEKPEPY